MIGINFLEHWLICAGLPPTLAKERAPIAGRRYKRLPHPMPWLYRFTVVVLEWMTPLLLLGKFSRASRLAPEEFNRLEQKMHHHRFLWVRLLYGLIRVPLWEQLAPEKKPTQKLTHPLQGKTRSPKDGDTYDVLIIGSGAGGAPLAWQLSRQGKKVAVIESGPVVELNTTAFALENYYLKQGLTVSTKKGFLPIFAGNTVGGTTSINSGTCLRITPEQLKVWDEILGTQFSQGELDPYLETAEQVMGVTVPPKDLQSTSAFKFEQGLQALGRNGAYILPRSAPNCQGSGRCCFICPTGAKQSTDLAFLPEAAAKGCVLYAETCATKIQESAQGVSVQVVHHGKSTELHAKKLVLSAGAFGTPALIKKNKLGNLWNQAGHHLRIHPAGKVFAYFDEELHGEVGVPQGMGYRAPELPRIVFEGIFTPKSSTGPLISAAGDRHRWWMERHENIASFGLMLVERSEGSFSQIAGWPFLRYAMVQKDVEDLVAGLLLLGKIYLAAGAKKLLFPFVGIKNEFDSIEELEKLKPSEFRQLDLLSSGFHPQGTVALGKLLDLDFRLKGTKSIHVMDASVLPASPGVNPQITIMGLSLYLADRLEV